MRVKEIALSLTEPEFRELHRVLGELQGIINLKKEMYSIHSKCDMIAVRLETARKLSERFTEGAT